MLFGGQVGFGSSSAEGWFKGLWFRVLGRRRPHPSSGNWRRSPGGRSWMPGCRARSRRSGSSSAAATRQPSRARSRCAALVGALSMSAAAACLKAASWNRLPVTALCILAILLVLARFSCAGSNRLFTSEMCVLRGAQVRRAIAGLDLPNNPLDELIDRLGGPPAVAEMTGRKGRLVRRRNGEQGVKVRARASFGAVVPGCRLRRFQALA